MVNGDMNVEIDNYATAPKPTTLKIALESLMAIEIEPVLKTRPRMTLMAHCCRWGYVTMTTAVYSLNNITLASALKSTVE